MSRQRHLGPHAGRRWPLAPLLELVGMIPTRFCRAYGINGTVMRHARLFGLNDRYADHWAIRAGYHPAHVWGPNWFTAADPTVTGISEGAA